MAVRIQIVIQARRSATPSKAGRMALCHLGWRWHSISSRTKIRRSTGFSRFSFEAWRCSDRPDEKVGEADDALDPSGPMGECNRAVIEFDRGVQSSVVQEDLLGAPGFIRS